MPCLAALTASLGVGSRSVRCRTEGSAAGWIEEVIRSYPFSFDSQEGDSQVRGSKGPLSCLLPQIMPNQHYFLSICEALPLEAVPQLFSF